MRLQEYNYEQGEPSHIRASERWAPQRGLLVFSNQEQGIKIYLSPWKSEGVYFALALVLTVEQYQFNFTLET